MKKKILLYLLASCFFTGVKAQGEWEKPSTPWIYNLGAGTGTGTIGGAGYTTGTTGGSTITKTGDSTPGFMPYPPSGNVMLSNIVPDATRPAGSAEWYLRDTLDAPTVQFVSSSAGRVAKLSMYDIAGATSVASFSYRISFNNNPNTSALDWRFAVGQTSGGSNQLNNATSGIPANPSTSSFPYFFNTIIWRIASGDDNSKFHLTYCYRGTGSNGETAGTTYEKALTGVLFQKGGTYDMELYCNNSSIPQVYTRNSASYTINANSMHIWANGVQLRAGVSDTDPGFENFPSYQLVSNSKLDACVFTGSTNTPQRSAFAYISNMVVKHVQAPLPVSLRAFDGASKNSAVILKWITESEQNNAGFDILRKTDSSAFSVIGHVNGAGNSRGLKNYSFTDYNASPGVNYYQLKQIDFDGKSSFSNIIAINTISKDQELNVYKNGSSQLVASVLAKQSVKSSTLLLSDLSGRVLTTINTPLTQGNNTITMNVGNIPTGVYTVSLITPEGKISKKVLQ